MGVIDWRDKTNLSNLSPGAAVIALGQILESLKHPQQASETTDAAADLHLQALSCSPEAQDLADAARAFHRKAIASRDCRPALRVRALEARETLDGKEKPRQTPEACAETYASEMKAFHRR